MRNRWRFLLLACWLAIGSVCGFAREQGLAGWIEAGDLPPEALVTLQRIKAGGPFPYPRDGVVFGNYEKRLPYRPRGYYHEYTVRFAWRKDRGPRRIISGREGEYYYTADHYRSFRRIRESTR